MTKVFADTFYFFALLNQGDPAHVRAAEFTATFTGRYFTTGWVLTELADGLARPCQQRGLFAEVLKELRKNRVRIIPSTDRLLNEGIDLYLRRKDKEWSLTDCISFVVMKRERITDALTGDHHFEQAGFRALLKP
jgi:predicted nucleic acid-binding protein